ncbi:MAG: hypothetical protein IT449_13905 [Phycisphaerales bacterium]|nr:hypothetical protein [Phycisphaerales bacterium]
MSRTDLDNLPRLSDAQRRLVADNCGLVAVHLRRHVFNLREPRRDREWEDLFQEGCIGLLRAAVRFDEAAGIPFAAFALPRIHQAVSLAIQERFSLVRDPGRSRRNRRSAAEREDIAGDGRGARAGGSASEASRRDESPRGAGAHGAVSANATTRAAGGGGEPSPRARRHDPRGGAVSRDALPAPQAAPPPRVFPLDDDAADRIADRRHRPIDEGQETIADRIRQKRRRAAHRAVQLLEAAPGGRADRPALIRRLETERVQIEAAEYRTSLRQIARESSCAFARVAQCEKLIETRTVELLDRDPELAELARAAAAAEDGMQTIIDDACRNRLIDAGAADLTRRIHAADAELRGRILAELTARAPRETLDVLVHGLYADLSEEEREALTQTSLAPPTPRRPRRKRPAPAADRGAEMEATRTVLVAAPSG